MFSLWQGLGIDDLTVLHQFPALQTLDLRDNCIKDVKPLACLAQLTVLNLSGNGLQEARASLVWAGTEGDGTALDWRKWGGGGEAPTLLACRRAILSMRRFCPWTFVCAFSLLLCSRARGAVGLQVLDFEVPCCHEGNMWNTGDRFLGSQVEVADLSHNSIASIRDLSSHAWLVRLDLSHNQISQITGLASLAQLRELNLSNNQIQVRPRFSPMLLLLLLLQPEDALRLCCMVAPPRDSAAWKGLRCRNFVSTRTESKLCASGARRHCVSLVWPKIESTASQAWRLAPHSRSWMWATTLSPTSTKSSV